MLAFPPLSQSFERGSREDRQLGVWRGWETARVVRGQLIRTVCDDGDEPVGVSVARARELVPAALRVAGWDAARALDIVEPKSTGSGRTSETALVGEEARPYRFFG